MNWNASFLNFLRNDSFLGVFPRESRFNNECICLSVIFSIRILVLIIAFYFTVLPHARKECDIGPSTSWGERIQTRRILITKVGEDGSVIVTVTTMIEFLPVCVSLHSFHSVWSSKWWLCEVAGKATLFAFNSLSGNWRRLGFEWMFCCGGEWCHIGSVRGFGDSGYCWFRICILSQTCLLYSSHCLPPIPVTGIMSSTSQGEISLFVTVVEGLLCAGHPSRFWRKICGHDSFFGGHS